MSHNKQSHLQATLHYMHLQVFVLISVKCEVKRLNSRNCLCTTCMALLCECSCQIMRSVSLPLGSSVWLTPSGDYSC